MTYSLKAGGDAAAFSINASTGAVTLTANPDDETKGSYSFTVVATDAAGNSGERAVSLGINDLDEVAPTITSSATANAITENSGADQIVYTVTSTDTGDISTGSTTYSLKPVNDSAAFSINASYRRGDADRQPGLRDEVQLQLHRGGDRRGAKQQRAGRFVGDQQHRR